VGPRVALDDMEKLKFLTLQGLELRSLSRLACNGDTSPVSTAVSCNIRYCLCLCVEIPTERNITAYYLRFILATSTSAGNKWKWEFCYELDPGALFR
jgi:hypothetical protein